MFKNINFLCLWDFNLGGELHWSKVGRELTESSKAIRAIESSRVKYFGLDSPIFELIIFFLADTYFWVSSFKKVSGKILPNNVVFGGRCRSLLPGGQERILIGVPIKMLMRQNVVSAENDPQDFQNSISIFSNCHKGFMNSCGVINWHLSWWNDGVSWTWLVSGVVPVCGPHSQWSGITLHPFLVSTSPAW